MFRQKAGTAALMMIAGLAAYLAGTHGAGQWWSDYDLIWAVAGHGDRRPGVGRKLCMG